MYIDRVMRTELVTVPPETTMVEARELTQQKRIDHLLVVDKHQKLVGIVSDRDLKRSWAPPATSLSTHELNYLLEQVTLEMIMTRKIITINPGTTIERAAWIMQENRISSLPVKDGEQLVGIITKTDVLGILLEAIGIDDDSMRFTVLVENRIGFMAEMTRILKDELINIHSIFAWPDSKFTGVYHLVMRVSASDGPRAVNVLKSAGYNVLTGYVKDLTPYLPKI